VPTSGKRMIYASRLMKAREVHEACKAFREQEAVIRRERIQLVSKKSLLATGR
jgi:hypothetical protein